MNKQVEYVNIVPAFENLEGYFPFQGTINTDYRFKAWNVQSMWEPEFYGQPTEEALSGRKRGNFRGYRLKVSILLDNTTQASGIRNLFNKFSGGFDRLVWETTFNATTTGVTNFVIASPAPSNDDWLNTLTASGFTGSPTTAIVNSGNGYDAGTQTVSVGDVVDTTATNPVYFYAKPDIETVVLFDVTGVSTTYTDTTLIPCNVVGNNYGASRESTINQQRVGLELESIELFKEIPSTYLIS